MLILSRKEGKSVSFDGVEVSVSKIEGNRVSITIKAPRWITILRGELTDFSSSSGSNEVTTLVLSRKENETIIFPNLDITLVITKIRGNVVRFGFEAPAEVRILRTELNAAA